MPAKLVIIHRKIIGFFIGCLVFFTLSYPVYCTDEYAEKTGENCEICHIDSSGGGELTPVGKGFILSVTEKKELKNGKTGFLSKPPLGRYFRLVTGYLHFITAFLWFGTILYVHIILKPAYAVGGLPPLEVKTGFISMFLMAVTGLILTVYRIPSISLLLTTRFGVLLLVKVIIFLIMVLSAFFVVVFVGPRLKQKSREAYIVLKGNSETRELAGYDGRNGNPVYFAYKGIVYDVSQSKMWKGGLHFNRHKAGTDLTSALAGAPHREEKITAMPEAGQLSSGKGVSNLLHRRVFYFIAYMNLIFVFVITFILALWRW